MGHPTPVSSLRDSARYGTQPGASAPGYPYAAPSGAGSLMGIHANKGRTGGDSQRFNRPAGLELFIGEATHR
jgi:hypothetical protein